MITGSAHIAPGHRPVASRRGYTLLELIVVVAILGTLLLVSIPAMLALNNLNKLDTAANDIATVFRYARGQAIIGEKTIVVRIDPKGARYRLDLMMDLEERVRRSSRGRRQRGNEERIRYLPEDVAFQDIFVWEDQLNDQGHVEVEFYPNGTVSPITIVLVDIEKRLVTVELMRSTGQSRVTDGKPTSVTLPEQSGMRRDTFIVEE